MAAILKIEKLQYHHKGSAEILCKTVVVILRFFNFNSLCHRLLKFYRINQNAH